MSSEFWSTLNKKKREELLKTSQTKETSVTREETKASDFWSALSPEKQNELLSSGMTSGAPMRTFMQDDDDDIAPVKGGNKNSIFKSGGFSDGVDGVGDFFGDLGQTVLGTTADLGLGILKGAGRLVEGVVDLGTYGVAGVADLFGADEFADKTKKVAQYSATDKWTKGATDYVDQYSVLGNKADAVSEGLGQVGAIILTGGAAGAAGLGSAGVSALTTGVTFASGMGSGMNEAYEGGATDGKAFAYGATSGAVEAVSELIFGGLGKGVKALGVSKGLTSIDDVVAKKISNTAAKFITSEAGQKVVGNTLEYAVKSGAEGLEEVISGFGSAIAKDVYLMNGEDEKAFGEILKDENLLEQFVVGSIVSGIAQGGDFIKATKNGRDFVSGLSKNEQTVVDKVYEQRLAEESENKTLSNKDKNKLYDRVVEEMKKGYISTDEIESILGGKTYEGYKSLTDKKTSLEERKTAIEKEIKELVKTPKYELTVEQDEKITALREEAKGIKEELQNLGIKTAKNNLFNEVNKLTSKDTYLRESYNDLIRKEQDIQIDENQYKGTKFEDAAKKTIANARNAGANNSNRVRDFVEFSAKYSSVSGKVIDFKKDADIKGTLVNQLKAQIDTLSKSTTEADKAKLAELQDTLKKVQEGEIRVNGVKTKDGVAININSSNYLNTVLGHEVTHFLESNKAYEALQKAVFKFAQTKGDYEGRRKVLDALYKNIDGTTVDYELTADLVGDYIFTEYDFIKNLSTENRNVFQQIYDQIKYMFKLATAGSKEARELEKVMHNFEKALRESVGTKNTTENSGVKYSLVVKETNGKEQIVNPYNITRDDVVDFLKKSSKGDLENNTYFPIASNTPQTIISTLKNAGVVTTDKPLAMQAKKARQSQTDAKPYTTKDGIVTRFHKMSAEEIIETIEKLNDPEIAIYQTNRTKTITNKDGTKTKVPAPDNFAFFVTLDSGKESVAVVEFDSVIDENYLLQDGKGEEYHTTVTVFIPDIMRDGMPFDYAEYLLRDGNNIEIDIIKESPKTKSAYSEILATDSETELSDDIISQKEKNVNTQFSVSTDIDGNTIDAERISSNEFDTKYSISHNADIAKGQAEYFSKNKAYISADELKEAQRVTNAMVDVMMKYSSILPEDKIGKVLTKNGSYDRSVENTTICVRTLAYNEFVDKVQEEIGRPLTQMESFLVSQKLYDIATEPQCLYCYVSLDRKAFNDMLLRYMQDRDTVIAKYNNSDKSSEAISKLYEEFLNGRKDTKEMKSRFDNWLNYVDNGTQLLSLADIATEDRQSVIKAEGGNLSEQLADARKYAQSASWSKIQKNYVAYRDEILKLGDRVVKNLNEHYGLRWYSFSDYSAAFIVENMQQITDASIRGLKGLSYTKDTDYAEIFAPSGMNINISVFVNQDADGNFYIDEKQSANFEKALELREQYPNVGIVATVTNDEALRWVGEQGWSDVIIPFHIVRTGADVAEYYKWLNYTSESADTVGDKNLWDAYVDSLNPKTENARKKVSKNIYPSEHQNNKATYLALCESRGLTPRFARFASEAWYMKLVNETRLSADNSSVLKPNYNLDAAKASFQKFVDKGGYEGGWYKDGVNVDEEVSIVANDVLAGKKANEVDYGRQDGFAPEDLIANRKNNRTHGKLSLSYEGENRTLGGSYRFDGKDFLKSDIAPVAKNATTTETTSSKMEQVAPTQNVAENTTVAQTIDEKIAEKLKNLQTELENNKRLRDESNADFDAEIARLQAEYDAKKDKNTKVANNLLRRIERIQRLKANVNADYDSRINSLGERVQKMQTPQYKRAEQRRAKQEQFSREIRNLIGDTSTWKDKKLGIFYQINTLHRNLRDVVRDANGNQDIAKADEIYEYLQGSYNHNEAQLKRESRDIKQKYADMKINKYESEYIQMLGEFKYNPDTKLTLETVDNYFNEHKDRIDIDKVNKAIEESRKDYDNLLKRVNAVLREQGMKEIGYREGYFPHFTDTKQGWLAKLLNWKTIDTEIPTDIAGLTEEFNPVRTYQSYDKHRKTDETDYNFLKGFDTYVHGALDWIYHIEDIQKRRAFENEIRYSHSEQGIRDRIDEIRQNETLDDDEARAAMDEVYRKAKNPLNNFVTDLRNSTNNLAGKKSTADREMEYATNRKIYSTMTNISNRVSADMVVGSISSATTNFIPITQSWGQVSPVSSLRAIGDVVRNAYRDDGMIKKSDFMTNRLLNEENLNQTGWDKVSNVLGYPMNVIDHFSTEVIWRSKYQENLNNGMSEAEAIHNADIFAENVMAGRSRGNMPTIYNSKNPLTKMLTAFQLEVGNQYGYMFKDMPQDIGKENIGKLTAGYAKMFIGAYVYNALFSALTGRDAAFDPIGILEDLLKDLGFGGDDEEEDVDVMGALSGLGENIAQEIPYVGGLLGGGRVPISSAIPYDNPIKTITGTMEDVADKDWANLTKEWLNLFYYGVLPMGGGQLKKFNEGMAMFSDDHPVSGSYTTSGNLRFPVEDTLGNRVQAALFGQYASKNAREYFDNDYAPLKEKQIQEYQDVDLPIADYWKYREGLSGLKTNADKADYINSLDIENWQKNLLLNNILDRKEDVDMSNYDDYDDWEEFDYAQKNPDKYAFAKSVGGYSSYKTYSDALYDIKADKDENGKSISGSRKEKVINYLNNLDADYETKIILFKSEYPSDDTYNMDIINYINGRTDLTYEERVSIFTELGFTVSNGSVYWD